MLYFCASFAGSQGRNHISFRMISSTIPFPPVSWWVYACRQGQVVFDLAEHYGKMSYRNRYYLASAQGRQLMSIPLHQGRNQRIPVAAVQTDPNTKWQDNHWKTIVSLYGRSPFFPYFDYLLQPLFRKEYPLLHDFNLEGIALVNRLLDLGLSFSVTHEYRQVYPSGTADLREAFCPGRPDLSLPAYYQVFAERSGFQADCSILDLLFCEGKQAAAYLAEAAKKIG